MPIAFPCEAREVTARVDHVAAGCMDGVLAKIHFNGKKASLFVALNADHDWRCTVEDRIAFDGCSFDLEITIVRRSRNAQHETNGATLLVAEQAFEMIAFDEVLFTDNPNSA